MLRPEGDAAPQPVDRTFGDYVEHEWAQYVRDNWKNSTQTTQGSFVRVHIVPYFEQMLLSRIKPTNVVEFHTAMEAKGLSKKSRRNLHAILTKMFTYAHDLELILANPVKRGIAPKVERSEKPALSEEQLYALFDVLPVRMKAFYVALAFTGIRTGEALGLKWEDVDFATHELHIRRAIFRGKETTPKTSSSIRPRPMVPELYQALRNHKTMSVYSSPADYVFASSTGRPTNPDQLREVLQAALKNLNIKFDQAGGAIRFNHRIASFFGHRAVHGLESESAQQEGKRLMVAAWHDARLVPAT
jgi:integrase